MKTAKKVSFYLATTLFLLIIIYLAWANIGLGSNAPQTLRLDATEAFGDSSNKGNLLGVQAFMEPIDYASKENFSKKVRFYLAEAKKKGWLIPKKTIVVFPEYFGTWLVTLDEKESIYQTPKIEEGLQTMVMRNIGKFAKTYISSPDSVKDKVKYSVFAMKAPTIARVYQEVFSALAKEYQVTIVGGSILLPEPSVEYGMLKTGSGLLYNTSAVFEFDGQINSRLIKKAFPTADELGFICPVNPKSIPVFQTPIGRMGVLICADAWFSDAYKVLKTKQVDFVITPSYSNGVGYWNKPWNGYSGAETPEEAKTDVGKISLGEAWVKYAMGTRAKTEAGVRKGINVFLQGNLWDLGADGSTIVLSDSARATPYVGKSALINLWL
ncbi:carbon-nitrogen hydrolase family protein [Emticicia fontis]